MASQEREIERLERKKAKAQKRQKIAWVIIALVVLALIVMRLCEIDFSSIGEKKDSDTAVSTSGFPYELDSGDDISFGSVSNSLYVLDETSYTVLSPSDADVQQSFAHGYSNPVVAVSGSYSLLYDQGGVSYKLDTAKDSVYLDKSENTILSADVSSSGSIILSTTSDEASSTICVYDKNLNLDFRYNVSYGYVTRVAIDSRGSRIAFAAVNSENAQLKTVVYTMNIDDEEPRAQFEYYSSSVLDLRFSSTDLFVVGNDFVSVISSLKDETKIYEQGNVKTVSYSYNSSDKLIFAYSDYSGSSSNKAAVINRSGKVQEIAEVDSVIKDITASSSQVTVLTSDEIITYKISNSEVVQRTEVDDSYSSVEQMSSSIFAKHQTLVELIQSS